MNPRLGLHGAVVALLVLAVAVAGRFIDVRRISGDIKGDEATYIAMALSLADDQDLRYEPQDFKRFTEFYGHGPSGIFLKRLYDLNLGGKTPVPTDRSLGFGKAIIYPVVAAPFVAIGGLGGMLLFNWLLLGVCVWCGAQFCRTRMSSPAAAWAFSVVFIGASCVPIFAAWMTSDVFNFALIFVAYFLWLYKKAARPDTQSWLMSPWSTAIAALLVGLATYSKWPNGALMGPIALDVLLTRNAKAIALVTVAFVLSSVGMFGLNFVITGEANYQGAATAYDRRSFYNHYPFDADGTQFEMTGSAMTTNDADTGRVLAPSMLAQLPANIGFFLVGRHAGFVPYYFPGAVVLVAFLLRLRRSSIWQWTTLLGVIGSTAGYLLMAPDSWNGGGGPPGNRYFLALYPPLLFLIPAGTGVLASVMAAVGGWACIGVALLHPYRTSAATWTVAERAPLRWLPIELTLINDLPVKLHPLRNGILFVPEPTVLNYYMDAHTYSAEGQGFWVAGGTTAETVMRTDTPLRRVKIVFTAGPIENHVRGRFADRAFDVDVHPGQETVVQLPRPACFKYGHSCAYVLHIEAATGFVPASIEKGSTDTRNLGVFVQPSFYYDDTPDKN